jgi:membrane peptidoglycan carboxypeptidase
LKRLLIRLAFFSLGGISAMTIVLAWLHYTTRDNLEYLVRAVKETPQTARLQFRDAKGRIFDTEVADITYSPMRFTDIDPELHRDLVLIEDKTFFQHSGIDYARTFKAALDFAASSRLPFRKKPPGGSTLTQQLVKNLLGHHQRTLEQKIREIFLAYRLETRLRAEQPSYKTTIIESYWKHLFITQRRRGLGHLNVLLERPAATAKLSAAERVAVLALVRAPSELSQSATAAQNFMNRMAKEFVLAGRLLPDAAVITGNFAGQFYRDYAAIRQKPVTPAAARLKTSYARSVKSLFQIENPHQDLEIQTPRLSELEAAMRDIFEKRLNGLNTRVKLRCGISGAFMLVRLHDAAVVAAGEDPCSDFNELIQSRRQVSSTIKPFLYTFAMASQNLEPSSIFSDKRVIISKVFGKPYAPGNHYKTFRGPMNLKTALQISANTISLQLFEKMDAQAFGGLLADAYARYPGEKISPYLHSDYSLALGTIDLAPSHVAAAYLALLSGGSKRYPRWRTVSAPRERSLPPPGPARQIFDPLRSEQTREMLTAVMSPGGTGGAHIPQNGQLVVQELGAKSGSGPFDTWFVGFSEDLLLVVWLGFRKNEGIARDFHAAPLWSELFLPTLAYFPPRQMTYSPLLERRYFCGNTGLPPDAQCRRIHSALFRKDKR